MEIRHLNYRNAALIAMLNDVGFRISEALSMDINHVKESSNGDYLIITCPKSKTEPRTVISYLAMPYIQKWLSVYKTGKDSSPLFCDRYGNRLEYFAAKQMLTRLINKQGLKLPERKKCHIFRHLAATRFSRHFNSVQMDYWFGWSGRMQTHYSHVTFEDCVAPYFAMLAGENNPLMPKKCPCGFLNQNSNDFCEKCGNKLQEFTILSRPESKLEKARAMIEGIEDKKVVFALFDEYLKQKQALKAKNT